MCLWLGRIDVGAEATDHDKTGVDYRDYRARCPILQSFFLRKSYEVTGLVRRSSHFGVADHRLRWLGIEKEVRLVGGNLTTLCVW